MSVESEARDIGPRLHEIRLDLKRDGPPAMDGSGLVEILEVTAVQNALHRLALASKVNRDYHPRMRIVQLNDGTIAIREGGPNEEEDGAVRLVHFEVAQHPKGFSNRYWSPGDAMIRDMAGQESLYGVYILSNRGRGALATIISKPMHNTEANEPIDSVNEQKLDTYAQKHGFNYARVRMKVSRIFGLPNRLIVKYGDFHRIHTLPKVAAPTAQIV